MNYDFHPLNNHYITITLSNTEERIFDYFALKGVAYEDLVSATKWETNDAIGIENGTFNYLTIAPGSQMKEIKLPPLLFKPKKVPCLPCTTCFSWDLLVSFDAKKFVETACRKLGITKQALANTKGKRDFVEAKKLIALLLKEKSKGSLTLAQVSNTMGFGYDHSAAIFWINSAKKLLKTNSVFKSKYELLNNLEK